MSIGIVIAIIVAILVIGAVVAAAVVLPQRRRSAQLRERFGPEYNRVLERHGSRKEAEAELSSRQDRRDQLEIRELEPAARERYLERWRETQKRFVDAPGGAIEEADRLVAEVMRERGYPVDDFEQRSADISVDHPHVVENYREAHRIAHSSGRNEAGTEDLRQAMVHYRSLFDELLGGHGQDGGHKEGAHPGEGTGRREEEHTHEGRRA